MAGFFSDKQVSFTTLDVFDFIKNTRYHILTDYLLTDKKKAAFYALTLLSLHCRLFLIEKARERGNKARDFPVIRTEIAFHKLLYM